MTTETGVTMFNSEAIRGLRDQEEAEREAEREEEEKKIDEEIQQNVQREMAQVSVDLVESDSDDDDAEHHRHHREEGNQEHPLTTPATNRVPYNQMLTSTPYVPHFDIEEGLLGDTPDGKRIEMDKDKEAQYLNASSNAERLEILYEARGHEIMRLRKEVERLQEENSSDTRRLRHEVALLKAENEELKVKLDQAEDAFSAANEESRSLRNDMDMMRQAMKKQEKTRDDLIARAESSENMVHTLQNQLLDFQKKDTALRAREHHDAIVRSLKERHENEMYTLQQEVDRLTAKVKKLENDNELLRGKMDETMQNHDRMLVEKSERIEELSGKLAEAQKRLTELIVASSGQDMASKLGTDPVKEICDLKTKLSSMTEHRREQEKVIKDLTDELEGLKVELSEAKERQNLTAQKEISELRYQAVNKNREIENLKKREKELVEQNEKLKNDLAQLGEQVLTISKQQKESGNTSVNEALIKEVETLRFELEQKTREMETQQSKVEELIKDWDEHLQKIVANHGKDYQEMKEIKTKYKDLKSKVKIYQRHREKEREYYNNEIQRLRESFASMLLEYRTKMEGAVRSKEEEVEKEVLSMQQQFNLELERFTGQRLPENDRLFQVDPPSVSVSSSSKPAPTGSKEAAQSIRNNKETSDEENNRPISAFSRVSSSRAESRSDQLAKIFESVTKDALSELKRPNPSVPQPSGLRAPLRPTSSQNQT